VSILHSEPNMITNTATADSWLLATQDLKLIPFDPKTNTLSVTLVGSPSIGSGSTIRVGAPERIEQPHDPGFGTHIKEAVEIVKDWVASKSE